MGTLRPRMQHGHSREQGVYFPVGRLNLVAGWLKACYETQKATRQGEISLVCISQGSPYHEQVRGNSTCPQETPICHGKDLGKTVVRGSSTRGFHPGSSFPSVKWRSSVCLMKEGLARQDLLLDGGIEVSD